MLFMEQHLSLACLEVLVHLDKSPLLLGYAWSKAELPQRPEVLDIAKPPAPLPWVRPIPPMETCDLS
jgi:hypothetical protein